MTSTAIRTVGDIDSIILAERNLFLRLPFSGVYEAILFGEEAV